MPIDAVVSMLIIVIGGLAYCGGAGNYKVRLGSTAHDDRESLLELSQSTTAPPALWAKRKGSTDKNAYNKIIFFRCVAKS